MIATGFAARAAVTAERDPAGRTRIRRLRSEGPLALRESGGAVYLVGAGAGPLGGDDLALDIDLGPGARLDVRSAAASLVLPGRDTGPSRFAVRARLAAGARLRFAPEPAIAAARCDHVATAEITLADGAELVWREEIVLGRHAERPGRYLSRIDVTSPAGPLLRHELRIDDEAASVAVLGRAKAAGTVLIAGPGLPGPAGPEPDRAPAGLRRTDTGPGRTRGEPGATRTGPGRTRSEPDLTHAEPGLAVLPLAGPGVLVTAVADDAVRLRYRLDRGHDLVARRIRELSASAAACASAPRCGSTG